MMNISRAFLSRITPTQRSLAGHTIRYEMENGKIHFSRDFSLATDQVVWRVDKCPHLEHEVV